MITRRQMTSGALLVCLAGTSRRLLAQATMCATFTNGTVRYCDDQRANSGQSGPPSSPPLSPTPWRTWSADQLRQWDADVARWGNVSRSTYNAVQTLAASLPEFDPQTGEQYTDLKAAISGGLRDAADEVISNTLPDPPETERFWSDLRSAADGWQRLKAVSKADILGQYTHTKPDLSTYLHANGLIKNNASGDPLGEVSFSGGVPDAFTRSTINSLEFTRGVLADALEVAGPNYTGRAQAGTDALFVYELLLISAVTHPGQHSSLMLALAQKVVNDLSDFFDGLAVGSLQSAAAIIDLIENLVTSPIQTVSAIADAIWPIDDYIVETFKSVVGELQNFIKGTPYERGVFVGNLVVALLTAELGAGAASRLGGTALGARIGAAYTSLGEVAAASWLAQRVATVADYLGTLKTAFRDELRATLRFGSDSEAIAASLSTKLLEAEYLEGFLLYPDETKLPEALKAALLERRDVLSETQKLVAEAARIAVNGRFSSLEEVRETIDKLAFDSGLEGTAFQYADKRLATAFEQVKARQVNGTSPYFDPPKGTPGAREYDVISSSELIQCSMKEFKSQGDIANWLGAKNAQIEATVDLAGKLGLQPTYWFRWQPEDELVRALKGKGVKNVRWDLPPR